MNISERLARMAPDAPETSQVTEYGIAYRVGEELRVDEMSSKEGRDQVFVNYLFNFGPHVARVERVKVIVAVPAAWTPTALVDLCEACGEKAELEHYYDDRDGPGQEPCQMCESCVTRPGNAGHLTPVVA